MRKYYIFACLVFCSLFLFSSCKTESEVNTPEVTSQVSEKPLRRTAINFILGAFIQGHTNPSTNQQVPHTVNIYLAHSYAPYAIVDSATSITLNYIGRGDAVFNNVSIDSSYYVVVKSNNTLETWSSNPVTVAYPSFAYDFRVAKGRAYDSNMVQVGTRWTIYSGDITPYQEGFIDFSDINEIVENMHYEGFIPADITGDQVVDSLDLNIAEINAYNYVGVAKPQ